MTFKVLAVVLIILLALARYVYATVYETESIEQTVVIEATTPILMSSELKRICSCESNGQPDLEPRQFNQDGTVLRGVVNSQDIGMCQINLSYHGEVAEQLDIDVFTRSGNIEYANYLYSTQGNQPWYLSEHCWGQ